MLESPKSCLVRAQELIDDLEAKINQFSAGAYNHVIDVDKRTGDQLYKFKLVKPIPMVLSNVAKDAIVNLRDALDQLGFACAVATGNPNSKQAYFPFADSPEGLKNVIGGRCRDLPEEIVKIFESFKPYKTGNHNLWALNLLANTGKHRLVVPTVATIGPGIIDFNRVDTGPSGRTTFFPSMKDGHLNWDAVHNEVIMFRLGVGGRFDGKISVQTSLALNEPPSFRISPAAAKLREIAAIVQDIVNTTEAKCQELGLNV
jgi:hypothetical protein